jgi:hypothetical protein
MSFFMIDCGEGAASQCGLKVTRSGTGLNVADLAPPRHQHEEGEVEQGADLRDERCRRRRRLDAQVAQHEEEDTNTAYTPLCQPGR